MGTKAGSSSEYIMEDVVMDQDRRSEAWSKDGHYNCCFHITAVSVDAVGKIYAYGYNDPDIADSKKIALPFVDAGSVVEYISVATGTSYNKGVEVQTAFAYVDIFFDWTSGSNAGNLISVCVNGI